VWDAETGETVSGPFQGHTDMVTSVSFSPDGRHIVSGSDDNTIRVWDAETGETVSGTFQGYTDWVTSVGFSPDGRHIVSSSHDITVKVLKAGLNNSESINLPDGFKGKLKMFIN
jgi:WD40 repeat protein